MTAASFTARTSASSREAKFWLAVNHLPLVEDVSIGFWRRVRLIPFLRTFTQDADRQLEAKLARELPGILAWAVCGATEWQKGGLISPPSAGRHRRLPTEERSFAEFVADCLIEQEGLVLFGGQAHAAYTTWARNQGWRSTTCSREEVRHPDERAFQLDKT